MIYINADKGESGLDHVLAVQLCLVLPRSLYLAGGDEGLSSLLGPGFEVKLRCQADFPVIRKILAIYSV